MITPMQDTATLDFPFVADLPKREKSKIARFWDDLEEFRAVVRERGTIVPVTLVAKILGVSRTRVYELIKSGRLEPVELDGHMYVGYNSLEAWAKAEHKVGRPLKATTTGEAWKVALEYGRETIEKKR